METKAPWQSKTLWFNLAVAVAAFFPVVSNWISAHPEAVPAAFGAVNFVLRLVSKDKIALS
jgi:hypothetical protein